MEPHLIIHCSASALPQAQQVLQHYYIQQVLQYYYVLPSATSLSVVHGRGTSSMFEDAGLRFEQTLPPPGANFRLLREPRKKPPTEQKKALSSTLTLPLKLAEWERRENRRKSRRAPNIYLLKSAVILVSPSLPLSSLSPKPATLLVIPLFWVHLITTVVIFRTILYNTTQQEDFTCTKHVGRAAAELTNRRYKQV